MAFSSFSSTLSCTPNVTPLIDVLLVLLIIFMVIVPTTPHGLDSLIPATSQTQQMAPTPSPLLLEILPAAAPSGVIYRLNSQNMDLPHLRLSLRSSWAQASAQTVFISGDPRLDYRVVAAAIAEAKNDGFAAIGLLPRQSR